MRRRRRRRRRRRMSLRRRRSCDRDNSGTTVGTTMLHQKVSSGEAKISKLAEAFHQKMNFDKA